MEVGIHDESCTLRESNAEGLETDEERGPMKRQRSESR